MEIFQLQGRLNSFVQGRISYSSKTALQHNSLRVLIIIVLAHLLLIFIAFNAKNRQHEFFPLETIMQLVQLQPEKAVSADEPEQLSIEFKNTPIHLALPELSSALNFTETYKVELDLSLPPSDQLYEFPDESFEQYKNVFDPKLRKKLIDAQVFNIPHKAEKPTTWTEIDGRVFIDMGNGQCFVSMQKIDSRERGTNWGFTRCGKTDSETMMDNITADLEARKHPLKAQ